MNRVPAAVAAFTLIEMMIAVALGSMVILVAMSGFRTASQTITVANRLSLENSMLRSGYFEAQMQLDFWTNLDDPTRPDTERPLKGDQSVGGKLNWPYQTDRRGLPFTPMKKLSDDGIWAKAGTVPRVSSPATLPDGSRGNWVMPRPLSEISLASWDLDRGWDPTFYWAPHDPRTWCRANMAEKLRDNGGIGNDGVDNLPKMISGRYAIFGNTSTTPLTLDNYNVRPDLNHIDPAQRQTIQAVSYSGYPGANIHSWYYNQLNSLVRAMGYAAFCEYLPANSIYTWYSNSGDRTAGGIDNLGIVPWYGFTNGDGDQRNSRGIYRNTYSCSYGYINPRSWDYGLTATPPLSGTPLNGDTLRQRYYQCYESDYGATENDGAKRLRWLLSHANHPEQLLDSRPSSWPEVQVSVGRIIKNAHHVAVAKVRRFSPLNGELIELSWTGLGTTLRGARQQRHQTIGWARWDNASGATLDPHLDTP
ncbi:MAG: hypothetical protein H0W78_14610 [Planctomycetes bacterium]|nr:hypothetical protein [Planctomycetota bacterium]